MNKTYFFGTLKKTRVVNDYKSVTYCSVSFYFYMRNRRLMILINNVIWHLRNMTLIVYTKSMNAYRLQGRQIASNKHRMRGNIYFQQMSECCRRLKRLLIFTNLKSVQKTMNVLFRKYWRIVAMYNKIKENCCAFYVLFVPCYCCFIDTSTALSPPMQLMHFSFNSFHKPFN